MAYGVVPIASDVSSIPEFLRTFETGTALTSRDPGEFAGVIGTYLKNRAAWRTQSDNAVEAASQFSYDHYLQAVRTSVLASPSRS